MFLLPLLLVALQGPTEYATLKEEYARPVNVSVLRAGLKSPDLKVQRLAVRAIGRLERASLRDEITPLLQSPDIAVRREAVSAIAQMNAPYDFAGLIATEKAPSVRAVIYDSIGRAKPASAGSEGVLVLGLKDADGEGRTGAARGLETLIRVNIKSTRPASETLDALRVAIRDNASSSLRQLALLALNAAGDQDDATIDLALRDPDPQVRRLAVIGSKRWVDDTSPIVRLETVRLAGTCERATVATADPSGQVALAAVDFLGAKGCDPAFIARLVDAGKSWRIRARALVSLAKVAPDAARVQIAVLAKDSMWQVRAYAAEAARIAKDAATLAQLASDPNPNVAALAITTPAEALRALTRDHSGLLIAAAAKLKSASEWKSSSSEVLAAVLRLTRFGRVTVRDARTKLIELLAEGGDTASVEGLRPLLSDRDPSIAALVAKTLTERTGTPVVAQTTEYVPEPFPSESTLQALQDASAVITMKGVGVFTIELLPSEAPATVAEFASLAERGAYNGLTLHRVVPNFVLQGGSPGADEYDALTPQFMRDELGFTSNARGTFGVSTRGRDTGDGQIFINLIDNWRLDHIYTVFARVTSGMDIVDRVLEGDVIESIRVRRRAR